MKQIKISLICAMIFMLFGCSAIPIINGNQSTRLVIQFNNSQTSSQGRQLTGNPRFLVSETSNANLTIQAPGEQSIIKPFISSLDGFGKPVFTVSVDLKIGKPYQFSVQTFDSAGNVLTTGNLNTMVRSGVSSITIPMDAANKLIPGQGLSLLPNQVAYFNLSSPVSVVCHLQGTGMTFWTCASDGSHSGPGNSGTFELSLTAGQSVLIRVSQNGTSGSMQCREQHWKQIAQLTDTGNYPTVTSATGWEFGTALGNSFYFATPNNYAQNQFFIGYNVVSQTKSNLNLTGNNLAAAGYYSRLVGVGSKVFYCANTGTAYDTSLNSWSNVTSYNALARGEPGVCAVGSKIYFYGSRSGNNDFLVFDTSTGGWSTTGAYSNAATTFSALATVNNKIYVMGGETNGFSTKFNIYDPILNAWTALPDIPYSSISTRCLAAAVNDQIYLFSYNSIYNYNATTGVWRKVTDTAPESMLAVGTIGSNVYGVAWNNTATGYVLYQLLP